MADDPILVRRVRAELAGDPAVTEKRMFGGTAFLLNGLMLVGVSERSLMARVGPETYEESLRRPHVRVMDFTGRPMRGYVYVDPAGLTTADELRSWLTLCKEFVASLPPKKPK